jgi:hypothetical protein
MDSSAPTRRVIHIADSFVVKPSPLAAASAGSQAAAPVGLLKPAVPSKTAAGITQGNACNNSVACLFPWACVSEI